MAYDLLKSLTAAHGHGRAAILRACRSLHNSGAGTAAQPPIANHVCDSQNPMLGQTVADTLPLPNCKPVRVHREMGVLFDHARPQYPPTHPGVALLPYIASSSLGAWTAANTDQ